MHQGYLANQHLSIKEPPIYERVSGYVGCYFSIRISLNFPWNAG